ncbi:hypothetical protein ACKS0A_05498 [Histoplasma ohiense]
MTTSLPTYFSAVLYSAACWTTPWNRLRSDKLGKLGLSGDIRKPVDMTMFLASTVSSSFVSTSWITTFHRPAVSSQLFLTTLTPQNNGSLSASTALETYLVKSRPGRYSG